MTESGDWIRRLLGLCPVRRRAIFVVYAALTVTATHWPKLELPLPSMRPDIVVHMLVFGLWTIAFVYAGFFGTVLSRRNILLGGAVSLVYSAVDEITQGLPGVNRVVALDDAMANAAGVSMGVVLCFLAARRWAASAEPVDQPMTKE